VSLYSGGPRSDQCSELFDSTSGGSSDFGHKTAFGDYGPLHWRCPLLSYSLNMQRGEAKGSMNYDVFPRSKKLKRGLFRAENKYFKARVPHYGDSTKTRYELTSLRMLRVT